MSHARYRVVCGEIPLSHKVLSSVRSCVISDKRREIPTYDPIFFLLDTSVTTDRDIPFFLFFSLLFTSFHLYRRFLPVKKCQPCLVRFLFHPFSRDETEIQPPPPAVLSICISFSSTLRRLRLFWPFWISWPALARVTKDPSNDKWTSRPEWRHFRDDPPFST